LGFGVFVGVTVGFGVQGLGYVVYIKVSVVRYCLRVNMLGLVSVRPSLTGKEFGRLAGESEGDFFPAVIKGTLGTRMLRNTAIHCQQTATHNAIRCNAHCDTLPTHYNTQHNNATHSATHCNSLEHTVTYHNTPQHAVVDCKSGTATH